jgi:hypothetical protein
MLSFICLGSTGLVLTFLSSGGGWWRCVFVVETWPLSWNSMIGDRLLQAPKSKVGAVASPASEAAYPKLSSTGTMGEDDRPNPAFWEMIQFDQSRRGTGPVLPLVELRHEPDSQASGTVNGMIFVPRPQMHPS